MTRELALKDLYLLYLATLLLASDGFGQVKTQARDWRVGGVFVLPLPAGLEAGRGHLPSTTPSSCQETLSCCFRPLNTALSSSERPLALSGLRETVANHGRWSLHISASSPNPTSDSENGPVIKLPSSPLECATSFPPEH